MFTRIKEWWYAILVCRKYGIMWNPFVRLGDGYYLYKGIVGVNPFDSCFMSTFLHEIGHHVHNKRVGLKNYLKAQNNELRFSTGNEAGRNVYKVLESEWKASRFAVKTGRADRKKLVSAFQTYTGCIFNAAINPIVVREVSQIIDATYIGIRRIEK